MRGGGRRGGSDAKFAVQRLGGRGRAEAFHPDEGAVVAKPAPPRSLDGGFDADPRRDAENRGAIGLRLRREKFKHGAETTAARISFSARIAAASTAIDTSEPVAIKVTSRAPTGSLST